jgi:hypothetical protein
MTLSRMARLSPALGVALLALCMAPLAAAEDVTKTYNGKIVISIDPFPKKMDDAMTGFLKAAVKKDDLYSLTSDGKTSWSFNLLAFLNKDPGGDAMNLVFYDKDDKDSQKKFEPIQSVELKSTKGSRLVSLTSISLSPDSGFSGGKTYLIRATQLKGGKEVVLAEAQITLVVK